MSKNTTKEKFEPIIIQSREAMTAVVNAYAADKRAHAAETLAMEEEIAKVQARYQKRLDELGRAMQTAEAGLQVWAAQNRHTAFPVDVKSIDLQSATIGFRQTPHRVEKIRSKDTWPMIALRMAAYRESGFDGSDFVVYPDPELSKKKLLAERKEIPESALKAVQIRFEQDELFFIDVKSDVVEGVTKKEEAA